MMNKIIITHNQSNLWVESKIFETLKDDEWNYFEIMDRCQKYAINTTKQFLKSQKLKTDSKSIRNHDLYKNMFGWMNEVFVQYYFMTIESNHFSVQSVADTSENIYYKGFDFLLKMYNDVLGAIQVKARSDPNYKFKEGDLFTFIQMILYNSIDNRNNVWLVIPTSKLSSADVLNYKFPSDFKSKFKVLTGKEMQKRIQDFGKCIDALAPEKVFFKDFYNCLLNSKIVI